MMPEFAFSAIFSRLKHYFYILSVSLSALLISGYRFGDADQNTHIPFFWKQLDPGLYSGSPFVELSGSQYSYFWHLFIPFVKMGLSLEWLAFAVFFLCLFLYFEAYYRLLVLFVGDYFLSHLCLLTAILPAFSFTIMPTYENYLVNRMFVMPLLLFAIGYFLQRRYIPAILLLGVSYNFHVISVNFVFCMFALAFLNRWRAGWLPLSRLAAYFSLFLVLASPVIFWRFTSGGMDLSVNLEWYTTVSRGVLSQIFHLFSFSPPTIVLSIFGLGNILVFLWVRSRQDGFLHSGIHADLAGFFLAIVMILFVAVITSEFFPLVSAIQLQLARVGKFVPLLAYPYFIGYISHRYLRAEVPRKDYHLLLVAVTVSGWLLPAWVVYHLRKRSAWIGWSITLSAATSLVAIVLFVFAHGQWKPGLYVFPQPTAWIDVQHWARAHTEPDDLFITPLHHWSHYEADFMLLSRRPNLVSLGELMYIAYHPDYFPEWRQRFESLVPGAIEQFNGNLLDNQELVARLYQQNTSIDFFRVARHYSASYVVVAKPAELDFDMVYENEGFRIYAVDLEHPPDGWEE